MTDFISIVRDGYAQMGQRYHEHRVEREPHVYSFLEEQLEFLPATGKVLDLGCGGGRPVAKFFAEKQFDVVGLDLSPIMIEFAKQSVPSASFVCGNMIDAEWPPSSFDIVVSFFTILHVMRDHHEAILRKLFVALKPGGVFLGTLGYEDREEVLGEYKGSNLYWSHYGLDTYRRMLERIGFIVDLADRTGRDGDYHSLFRAKKPHGAR